MVADDIERAQIKKRRENFLRYGTVQSLSTL